MCSPGKPLYRTRPKSHDDSNRGQMIMNQYSFTVAPGSEATAEVVARFIDAFHARDADAIPRLVADDCVMETMQPAPNGQRVEGFEANVQFWQAMVTDANGTFEVEDVVVFGDRAINRWRYHFGEGPEDAVRGVTLIRVRGSRIVEALAYAKTQLKTSLGQVSA
jgi:ketosteroid isomerase-like protein